jgi:hypothetical protein
VAVEPDFEIKRGATEPPLYLALTDGHDEWLPLELADSVQVKMRRGQITITGELVVLDPPEPDPADPDGPLFNARFDWPDGSTLIEGARYPLRLQVETDITWAPGRITTVPERGGRIVQINPDVG